MMECWKDGMLDGWKVGMTLLVLSIIPTFQLSLAAQDTIPPGYGTLRRDDVAVRLSTGTIEIQVLPLEEQVIRLLAPDTYRSLTELVQSRTADIADAGARAA